MAYGLKYQSDFYNAPPAIKLVSVKIYKKDYTEQPSPIYVRTQDVSITTNFQDDNTPVIGTGAKVSIIADTTSLLQYEDLLTSSEKQFKCTIEYNGEIVFIGYSLCDLNERQFLPYAVITLQFTDYLRRLESIYLSSLKDSGGKTTLAEIIQEALLLCDISNDVFINSSLFEETMDQGANDEFYSQTYLENYVFHSSPTEYDNGYDSLNKALLSFGVYLYQYKGKWCLERQEDVLRDDAWLLDFNMLSSEIVFTPSADTSYKQLLNKQDGDFKYIEMSQIIAYESGLKTLVLRLQDKQLESFVFNDYLVDNIEEIAAFFPETGTLEPGTWYRHTNVTIVNNGFSYRDMGSYIKWRYEQTLVFDDVEFAGIYHAFQIQFPKSPEEPVILNINFKQSVGDGLLPVGAYARLRFCIRVDGGPMDGSYLVVTQGIPGFRGPTQDPLGNEILIQVEQMTKPVFSASMDFNLTDQQNIRVSLGVTELSTLWHELGEPEIQKFMIFFFPMEWYWKTSNGFGGYNESYELPPTQYLGDVVIGLTGQKVLNKLTYYINADFEKTEELDIEFFDLENINFANGPMVLDSASELVKTNKWISELNATPVPLMDVFAKNRFQNYARTIHRLKGTILYDGYLKLFAILTDDNLKVGSNLIDFVLKNYTWDLVAGTYDIDAQEYTDEELGFDHTQDEGNGTGDESGGEYGVVNAPTGLDAVQRPNEGFDVTWDAMVGDPIYIVQRYPSVDVFGTWVNGWETIYEGMNNFAYDSIHLEVPAPTDGMSVAYKVMARIGLINGPYCDAIPFSWVVTP